jgi:hypothetical protein
MFAYQINATTPTQLTLVAYTKFTGTTPSLGYVHSDCTVWVQQGQSVQQYQFNGSSFVTGQNYSFPLGPITDICFTQAGTVLGVDAVNRVAYNMTLQTAQIIDVRFQESNITYSGTNVIAHIVLNVYDGTGARTATAVTLNLTGAVFSGGATSVQVTTSTSTDTIIPIQVSQPGLVSVVPSI